MDSRWYDVDELLHEFTVIGYKVLHLGIVKINPADIIGLSLSPEEVATDSKMNKLRKSVAAYGWNDPNPADFHLLRLPFGKYTVYAGGNHRAMLANDLELTSVPAAISVLIPNHLMKPYILKKLETLEREMLPRAERQVQLLTAEYKEAALLPGEKRKLADDMNAASKMIESINYQRNQMLAAEAYRLRLMPKEHRPLKVNIRPSKSS